MNPTSRGVGISEALFSLPRWAYAQLQERLLLRGSSTGNGNATIQSTSLQERVQLIDPCGVGLRAEVSLPVWRGILFVATLLVGLLISKVGSFCWNSGMCFMPRPAAQFMGAQLETLPGESDLTPVDQLLGMSCPTHSVVFYIPHLAGPWGLPIAMDGRGNRPGHKNLFAHHAKHERRLTRRVVIYYDLNYPQNTFCKARDALNTHGGDHVHVLTVGFPTSSKPRGLGYSHIRNCAPKWHRDYVWLSNRPASRSLSSPCWHSHILPTPCELLLGLIRRLQPPAFPNIEDVRIVGFSAGGQLLDKCMYSASRFRPWAAFGFPRVRFLVVSPSTLFYPIPERAKLKSLPQLGCADFDPQKVLVDQYDFRLPDEHLTDIANMTKPPSWYCYSEHEDGIPLHQQKAQCLSHNHNDREYVYKFTAGHKDLAPGCHHHGRQCWCCRQRRNTTWQQKYACRNYDHYRYGLKGRLPPDMPSGSSCQRTHCGSEVRAAVRRALLEHDALYVGGSADVCNWRLQSRFNPKCGWCLKDRRQVMHGAKNENEFARDLMSPVVDSCRAMWQGSTRFERMKIYKDAVEQVVAPRVGVSQAQLDEKRKFMVLVGAGHADNTVISLLAPCLIRDDCDNDELVPMRFFASARESRPPLPWGWPWASGYGSFGGI